MYNPTLRLLTILELLQSRGEMTGEELAQALEVEERSIRRYIMMLRDIGIPIESERGRHGGYSLRPGFRIPPMMFNADEITVVMMGLMLIRELGPSSALAIESAVAKIERVLPLELRDYLDALHSASMFEDIDIAAYEIASDAILKLTRAMHEQKCLDIAYISTEGAETQRRIAPYGLVLHRRAWYTPAYCHLREDVRVFRVDRIQEMTRTDEAFSKPAAFDPRGFVQQTLAQKKGVFKFEVLFQAPLSTVQTLIAPSVGLLEAQGNNTLLRCYSDDPFWMARYLARIELPYTVIKNRTLRMALRELADELRGAAFDEVDSC
jgi:predicted DNA-binding transcriptional regulator YafY